MVVSSTGIVVIIVSVLFMIVLQHRKYRTNGWLQDGGGRGVRAGDGIVIGGGVGVAIGGGVGGGGGGCGDGGVPVFYSEEEEQLEDLREELRLPDGRKKRLVWY